MVNKSYQVIIKIDIVVREFLLKYKIWLSQTSSKRTWKLLIQYIYANSICIDIKHTEAHLIQIMNLILMLLDLTFYNSY